MGRYCIVGDGRVARSMKRYFDEVDIGYSHWSRRLARAGTPSPVDASHGAETVLLLISDGSIEPFIDEWPALTAKRLVHFSGALVTNKAQGFHPLQTFSADGLTRADFERVPFIVEEDADDFASVFPQFKNPHYVLPKRLKPLYHALCVASGNFTTLLWQKVMEAWRCDLGLPVEVLHPYLDQVAKNLSTNPDQALTGPLARGDRQTIEKNLSALSGNDLEKIYQSFIDVFMKR